jgi:hypothetical protein
MVPEFKKRDVQGVDSQRPGESVRMDINLTSRPWNSKNCPRQKGEIRSFSPAAPHTARTVAPA